MIRVFNAEDGSFLQEVRRGSEKAEIYYISFDATSTFFCVSSDRGTVHIFSLATAQKKLKEQNPLNNEDMDESEIITATNETKEVNDSNLNYTNNNIAPKNQKSFWGKMTKIIPLPKYFNSEWSFAQFRIPDIKSICAFGPNNTLIGNYIF